MITFPALCIASIAVASVLSGRPGDVPGESLPDELVRTVRALQGQGVPEVEAHVPAVTAHGPEVAHGLLAMLRAGQVPALDGDAEQVLSRYQQELILRSLEEFGREPVAPLIDQLLAEPARPDNVSTAVLALGAVGQSSDLRRLVRIALADDVEQPDPRVERALETSLVLLLERDPRGFEHLTTLWQQARLELLPAMIRAVGATSDPRGVDFIGQVLRWRPELAPLAVAQLRRLGPAPDPDVNEEIADLLRPHLDPAAPDFTRAVILTLAELEDFHAVPRLIQLLDEPHGLGDNALWALRKLSGQAWGPSVPWWEHWYETETAWYQNGHRQARQRLESARQGTVAAALREYGEHRLYRHRLAAEVEAVLYRSEPTLRQLACETLGTLGSRRSIPALTEALTDDDPALREAARIALAAIGGDAGEDTRLSRPR